MPFKLSVGPIAPGRPDRKPLNRAEPFTALFDKLLPCSWREIEFPVTSIRVTLAHDLAEHKYYGVDGANVEATGRAPMVVEAVIPFLNGITPGKNEQWEDDLYPVRWLRFRRAFADRTTGPFVHPDLGEILCKPQSMQFGHEAMNRGGVEATCTWVETQDEGGRNDVGVPSPIGEFDTAIVDLDASLDDIRSLSDEYLPPPFEETFDTFLNKVSGRIDRLTTSKALMANKPAQLLNRLKQVKASADRLDTPLTWPVTDASERAKSALFAMQTTSTNGRKTARYKTQARSTLAGLLPFCPGNSIDDLIALNPTLLSKPDVLAGTVIRFYA